MNSLKIFQTKYGIKKVSEMLNELRFPSDDSYNLDRIIIKKHFIHPKIIAKYNETEGSGVIDSNFDIMMNWCIGDGKFIDAHKIKSSDLKKRLISIKTIKLSTDEIEVKHKTTIPYSGNPFSVLLKSTSCVRNRFHGYKMLLNLIYSKQRLKLCRISDDDKCCMCQEVESKVHLYFDCIHIKKLWFDIATKLKNIFNLEVVFNYEMIVFGVQGVRCANIINCIISHFKTIIYSRKIKTWNESIIDYEFNFVCFNEKLNQFSIGDIPTCSLGSSTASTTSSASTI